jgi:hypothetical protein
MKDIFSPAQYIQRGSRSSIRELVGKLSSIMRERNGSPSRILVEHWLSLTT